MYYIYLPIALGVLNPTELTWSPITEHVTTHNQKFTLMDMEKLVYQGISLVTPMRWKKITDHTRNKVEDHYWTKDGLYEPTEDFTINARNSSEESASSSECSSSAED